jgi:superfamily II DNA/RNA helicase
LTSISTALVTEEDGSSTSGSGNTLTTEQIVGTKPKSASLQDLDVCMYPGLTHERVIIKKGESSLLALTRLIRQELQKYESAVVFDNTIQRPRVVVFFPDEVQAKAAIVPLRDALWGDHKLCVLLPKTGFSPMTIMDQFKRNETSVMLATPNSVRGLDFPALTHCYTLYLPVDDPREYIHLAGRVGRVGHRTKGRVISILNEEDADQMDVLAQKLNFQFTDVSTPTAESLLARTEDGTIDENAIDYEKLRRAFEDTISLVDPVEEPTLNEAAMQNEFYNSDDYDEDDDEIDDEEDEDDNGNTIESEFQERIETKYK